MRGITSATKIFLSSIICFVSLAYGEDYQLTILHTNDIHSRIEQTDKYLGMCKTKDRGKFLKYINWQISAFCSAIGINQSLINKL